MLFQIIQLIIGHLFTHRFNKNNNSIWHRQMDQRIAKLIILQNGPYESRKTLGEVLASIKDYVDISIQELEDYSKKSQKDDS